MESENAIVFWNQNGEALITIVGQTSDKLIEIFDNPAIRQAIEESFGETVDNTSEELASLELKD
jgi:hypothetical protein